MSFEKGVGRGAREVALQLAIGATEALPRGSVPRLREPDSLRKGGDETLAITHYQDLDVWQRSMALAEMCYECTRTFPQQELFGLTSQIRRAASSIPANIAEGHARQHTKEFLSFLGVARGSLAELETHLILSHRVRLLDEGRLEALLALSAEVSRMLAGLRRSLQRKL